MSCCNATIVPTPSTHIKCDINAMLWKSQPGHFDGEGIDVDKKLEEWLECMDDYFNLAQSFSENKAVMGRFKLEKSAQLWWHNHYLENSLTASQVTWEELKQALKDNY